jgi:hypothetical protein
LLAALLLVTACAGRDTPADAWVFRDVGQKPGDPSLFEVIADEYRADPLGTAGALGALLGTVAAVVIRVVAR